MQALAAIFFSLVAYEACISIHEDSTSQRKPCRLEMSCWAFGSCTSGELAHIGTVVSSLLRNLPSSRAIRVRVSAGVGTEPMRSPTVTRLQAACYLLNCL